MKSFTISAYMRQSNQAGIESGEDAHLPAGDVWAPIEPSWD